LFEATGQERRGKISPLGRGVRHRAASMRLPAPPAPYRSPVKAQARPAKDHVRASCPVDSRGNVQRPRGPPRQAPSRAPLPRRRAPQQRGPRTTAGGARSTASPGGQDRRQGSQKVVCAVCPPLPDSRSGRRRKRRAFGGTERRGRRLIAAEPEEDDETPSRPRARKICFSTSRPPFGAGAPPANTLRRATAMDDPPAMAPPPHVGLQ